MGEKKLNDEIFTLCDYFISKKSLFLNEFETFYTSLEDAIDEFDTLLSRMATSGYEFNLSTRIKSLEFISLSLSLFEKYSDKYLQLKTKKPNIYPVLLANFIQLDWVFKMNNTDVLEDDAIKENNAVIKKYNEVSFTIAYDTIFNMKNIDLNFAICSCRPTPILLFATNFNNYYLVSKLISSQSIDINLCDNDGNNALHAAIKSFMKVDDKIVEALISAGVDINKKNNDGNTPLILAAKKYNLNAMKRLLANPKTNLYACNKKSLNAFHYIVIGCIPFISSIDCPMLKLFLASPMVDLELISSQTSDLPNKLKAAGKTANVTSVQNAMREIKIMIDKEKEKRNNYLLFSNYKNDNSLFFRIIPNDANGIIANYVCGGDMTAYRR